MTKTPKVIMIIRIIKDQKLNDIKRLKKAKTVQF